MNYIVFLTALLIIASKFLDCFTTVKRITSVMQEKNPLARKLMKRFGIRTTVWGIFIFALIIVAVSLWLIFSFYDSVVYKILFILIGLFISLVQFAVAHTNHTGRLNAITGFLLKRYSK